MKKIFIAFSLVILLSSCCTDEETFSKLKKPITVIGKLEKTYNNTVTKKITFQDATGKIETFTFCDRCGNGSFVEILYNKYNENDIIK